MKVRTGSNRFLMVGALLVGIVGLSGCATKRFVGQEVSKSSAASERRISEVQTQVEAAQTRVREHDTHLAELDKSTRDALERAEAAGKLARPEKMKTESAIERPVKTARRRFRVRFLIINTRYFILRILFRSPRPRPGARSRAP